MHLLFCKLVWRSLYTVLSWILVVVLEKLPEPLSKRLDNAKILQIQICWRKTYTYYSTLYNDRSCHAQPAEVTLQGTVLPVKFIYRQQSKRERYIVEWIGPKRPVVQRTREQQNLLQIPADITVRKIKCLHLEAFVCSILCRPLFKPNYVGLGEALSKFWHSSILSKIAECRQKCLFRAAHSANSNTHSFWNSVFLGSYHRSTRCTIYAPNFKRRDRIRAIFLSKMSLFVINRLFPITAIIL